MQTYTPTVPADNKFSAVDLNAFGSNYASQYGHGVSPYVQKQIDSVIYDATPQGYYNDLTILMMGGYKHWNTREKSYFERVFGRKALSATATIAGGSSTAVIPVTSVSTTSVAPSNILVLPNNAHVTVMAVDKTLNTITIKALSGQVLPTITSGDSLANSSTLSADGTNQIYTYTRLETIERYNYIQEFNRGTRFGRTEKYEMEKAGTMDYLQNNKREVLDQFRFDQANSYWISERGEGILPDGTPAMLMGGVLYNMTIGASPVINCTASTLTDAFEDSVLASQFKLSGTRIAYGTPAMLHLLSSKYKRTLTRFEYGGKDMTIKLELDAIEMAGERILLHPQYRWADPSCFPVAALTNKIILLDQSSITPVRMWDNVIVDETPDISSGMNQNKFSDYYIDGNMSIEFNNPKGCAITSMS